MIDHLMKKLWLLCCAVAVITGCSSGFEWEPAAEWPAEVIPRFSDADREEVAKSTVEPASVHVRGLVNLVSDGSASPSTVLFLLPDARDPAKVNVGPTYSYKTKHWPRLYLLSGEPSNSSDWKKRYRCHDSQKRLSYALAGKQLRIAGTGVRVDRSSADPGNPSSVYHLPKIDDLLLSPLGAIPADMRSGSYKGGRLATRVVVEGGWLQSSGLWESGGALKIYKFHEWNGHDLGPSTAVPGRPLATGLVLVLADDSVVLEECALDDPDDATRCRTITIAPDGSDPVRVSLENSPSKNHCEGDVHFSAHYVLREHSDDPMARKVLVPATEEVTGISPHYDNAQCSPAENAP